MAGFLFSVLSAMDRWISLMPTIKVAASRAKNVAQLLRLNTMELNYSFQGAAFVR
jgi:hypothetical protein